METTLEPIAFAPCPTCGALAQHIAGEPETWRHYKPSPMSDTTNTTSLRERHVADLRSLRNDDGPDGPYSAALDAAIAALSPPALEDDLPRLLAVERAWLAVCDTLTEVAPGWHLGNAVGRECACNAIRRLASPVAAQAVTDGWRPIESFGTSAQAVLLYNPTQAADACYPGHPYLIANRTYAKCHGADNGYTMWRPIREPAHPNAAPCDAQGASK